MLKMLEVDDHFQVQNSSEVADVKKTNDAITCGFQETRDIVIFVTLVAVTGIYLIVSSKLILDYLEIPGVKDTSNTTAPGKLF
ncbi:hypothetical protein MTO96_011453 [Rhipicephalus appendiculatus]